jgi:thiamine-phosphate pyrophosphorylase
MLRLTPPILMLITDRHVAGGEDALVDAVARAVEGGVSAVQLREKDLPPEALLPLALRLRAVTRDRATLIVNGPLEIALAAEADGVHLPEAAPPIERPSRPLLIGRSVHSREAAEQAWSECSDYLIAGPVFETRSHPGAPLAGSELIEAIAGAVAIPVLAVGGITAGRVPEVMRAGAKGVAVISAILASPSPREAARLLRQQLTLASREVLD